MEMQKLTSKDYFKTLKIIQIAMILGQVVMGVVFYVNSRSVVPLEPTPTLNMALGWGIASVVVICVLASMIIMPIQKEKIQRIGGLMAKMNAYRTLFIQRNMFLTFASIASLIGFFLTQDAIYFAPALLVMAWLIILFPSQQKIVNELILNDQERAIICDPNAIIAEVQIHE